MSQIAIFGLHAFVFVSAFTGSLALFAIWRSLLAWSRCKTAETTSTNDPLKPLQGISSDVSLDRLPEPYGLPCMPGRTHRITLLRETFVSSK